MIFLSGQNINLRPILRSDINNNYISWLNDQEVCFGNAHAVFPYTYEDAYQYFDENRKNKLVWLAIIQKQNQRHVGNIALQDIDCIAHSAEFAILIGDKTCWGKGVGREASLLLLRHAFEAMNFHRIHCATYANNVGMKKLALRLGMKEEGRRREAAFIKGCYVDVVEFGILRFEFFQMINDNLSELSKSES